MNSYSDMLNENIIIATYVTTLIGTGGNAGNQAGALIISAISSGILGFLFLLKIKRWNLSKEV